MNKKEIRIKFKRDVLNRDGFKCRICGVSDVKLDAHHITDRNDIINGGYVKENGITLCDTVNGCHIKAEKYHITDGLEFVEGFHPYQLYDIIMSSKTLAIEKSKKIK